MPEGVTAVTVDALTTDTLVAATPPIVTLDVPVKFVPVIVIAVPPFVEPDAGDTEVIAGASVPLGVLTTRNPTRLLVISGVPPLRTEERTPSVRLPQEPPRSTR
jgi:hypothetical protein